MFDPITLPYGAKMLFNSVKLKPGVAFEDVEMAVGEMCNVVKETYGGDRGGFIAGQVYEYAKLVSEGVTLSSDQYGSIFFFSTGFHALHVSGGLVAFLLIIARTFTSRRYDHKQAVGAVVTSYYWHFVDVVWIALFSTIYLLR